MATKKWSAKVDTESTYPEQGLFTKGAATIAKSLASHEVSPKGPASGMRMLNFYINRAGKNLSASRLKVLENAKTKLSQIIADEKEKKPAAKAKSTSHSKSTAKKSSSKSSASAATKRRKGKNQGSKRAGTPAAGRKAPAKRTHSQRRTASAAKGAKRI